LPPFEDESSGVEHWTLRSTAWVTAIEKEKSMPRLRVHNLAISLDGYAAGRNQSVDNPLGVGGTGLHEWPFATRAGRRIHGMEGGDEGLDDRFIAQGDADIGATIMGRNMFGPIRGAWGNNGWTG
jgi:hypothetical protein